MPERESGTNIAVELLGVLDPQCKIDTCEEWARWQFRGLLGCLALAGYGQARVICGRRTFQEQVELYGLGRSADELAAVGQSAQYAKPDHNRVSWLDPRYSAHVQGRAIDVAWLEYPTDSLDVVGYVARQLGITWGGVWSVRDYAHFEI